MSDDNTRGRKDPHIAPHREDPYFHPDDSYRTERGSDAHQEDTYDRQYRDTYRDDHYTSSRDNDGRYGDGRYDDYESRRDTLERYPQDHRSKETYSSNRYDERYPPVDSDQHSRQRSITYPVRFHGNTAEFFKIWIVNVLLTIVTLYIYSAWAKVRTKRYFYGNTTVDNSSFEYHATGRQLVVGRLIAAVLLITYTFSQGFSPTLSMLALGILVLMFPWAVWRSLRFNARASSYRNIRFGFDGDASPPYANIILIPALVIAMLALAGYLIASQIGITNFEQISGLSQQVIGNIAVGVVIALTLLLTLLIPLLHKNLISYSLNNHRYGTARFSAAIKTGSIYGIHFLTMIISLLAITAVGAIAYGLFKLFLLFSTALDSSEILTKLEPFASLVSVALVYLVAVPLTGIAVAFFKSRIRNHRYNAASIGSTVQFNSTTTVGSLWWLNISNLALLILSLGLAYPYTKIRSARYFAKHTTVTVAGGLDSFTEQEKTRLHAMGEEMADAFDVEFDIGI